MRLVDHIQAALVRGRSEFTLAQIMDLVYSGRVRVMIGDHMSCSWMPSTGEIVHVGGSWDQAEARWMWDTFASETETQSWDGRKGWRRFLRLKGFKT